MAGSGPKRLDQRGQDGGAGGRGQFAFDRRFGQRDAAEQFGGGRGGNAALAVGDLDRAPAGRHRRGHDAIHAQQVPAHGRADDVGNRVGRADLVKMNFFDRRAVDFGLGLGQPGEDASGEVLLPLVELSGVDHRQDVATDADGRAPARNRQ